MKKTVAVLSILTMLVSATPAFAKETTNGKLSTQRSQEMTGTTLIDVALDPGQSVYTSSFKATGTTLNLYHSQYSDQFTEIRYRIYKIVNGTKVLQDDFYHSGDGDDEFLYDIEVTKGATYIVRITNYSREDYDDSSSKIPADVTLSYEFE